MEIWYTNADSLPNKMNELQCLIAAAETSPDILVITEAKPKNSRYELNPQEMYINGYDIFTNNWDRGRGILVFARSSLQVCEINQEDWPNFTEYLVLDVKLKGHDKLRICTVYRSPSSSGENNQMLNGFLRRLNEHETSHILVLGDFNYPAINWSTNTMLTNGTPDQTRFLDTINDNLWFQHVTQPTRERSGSIPTILDLVMTNQEEMVNVINHTSPLGKSDHCMLHFSLKCYSYRDEEQKERYNIKKADTDNIRACMEQDWNSKMLGREVGEQWQNIRTKILELQEKYVPKLKKSSKQDKQNCSLEKDAVKIIKKKHRAWQRYIETKDENKRLIYVRLRNQAKNEARKARKKVEQTVASSVKTNPKAFWAYVNARSKIKSKIPDLEIINDDGKEIITDDREKAGALLNFFSSVFVKESMDSIPTMGPPMNIDFEQENVINEEKIKKKVRKLKQGKSPGPDLVPTWIIKETEEQIAKPLNILFNNSLQQMKLPTEWKLAKITAIHKKGPKKLCENYRPVSLTCIICKIMESLIRDVIMEHMKRHKLFTSKQYGFLSGRSTALQLLKTLDMWTEALDKGESVEVIYLDFQKAFDQVPHKRLLNKLSYYGIKNPVHGWIKDFLQGRNQFVAVGKHTSDKKEVLSGIPQGSVLGPLLFVIYVNDIPGMLQTQSLLFADDTKLFNCGKDAQSITTGIEADLETLEHWSTRWLLKFNPSKCKKMVITRQQNLTTPPRMLYDHQQGKRTVIEEIAIEKDLGVHIDNNLNFKEHIGTIIKKANKMLGIIRRSFINLDKTIFVPLYTSLVRSHLEYAQAVWSPYLKGDIQRLEQVQRRATKLVNGTKKMNYTERLKFLKLPTLLHRRKRGDMIETYKVLHGLYDHDCVPTLHKATSHTRGHPLKLFKVRTNRLELRRSYFTNRIVDDWNKLPEKVVMAKSLNSFKNQLDKHWGQDKYNISGIWSNE